MNSVKKIYVALLISFVVALPLSASAALVPFGGFITMQIPCSNGGFYLSVVNPSGIGSGIYIWSPVGVHYPFFSPHIGGAILGMAGVPAVCMFGKVPVYGMGITIDGTSLIP